MHERVNELRLDGADDPVELLFTRIDDGTQLVGNQPTNCAPKFEMAPEGVAENP